MVKNYQYNTQKYFGKNTKYIMKSMNQSESLKKSRIVEWTLKYVRIITVFHDSEEY